MLNNSDDSLDLRLQITLPVGTDARPLLLLVRELGGTASYAQLMPSGKVVVLPVSQADFLTPEERDQQWRELDELARNIDPSSISEQIEFLEAESEFYRTWQPSKAAGKTPESPSAASEQAAGSAHD